MGNYGRKWGIVKGNGELFSRPIVYGNRVCVGYPIYETTSAFDTLILRFGIISTD